MIFCLICTVKILKYLIIRDEVQCMYLRKLLPPDLFKTTTIHKKNTSYLVLSSVLQVLLLLEGKAHAYVFASPGCKKWDTCAPEAVLHAVGGKLTDIHGNYYQYQVSNCSILIQTGSPFLYAVLESFGCEDFIFIICFCWLIEIKF